LDVVLFLVLKQERNKAWWT